MVLVVVVVAVVVLLVVTDVVPFTSSIMKEYIPAQRVVTGSNALYTTSRKIHMCACVLVGGVGAQTRDSLYSGGIDV